MIKTEIKFKWDRYEFGIDYINLTLFLSFITLFVEQTFRVSSIIYFFIDVPIVLMLGNNLKRIRNVLSWKPIVPITITLTIAFVFMIFGSVANKVPLGNTIYGVYKYFRGFFFFFGTLALVDSKSLYRTYKFLNMAFWINVILTFIEFFLLGINQDLLGGIFGLGVGVNQYTNLFFVVISIYFIEKIVNRDVSRKENNWILIMSILMLAIAAFAEMKYFFAEFLILFFIAYFCLPKEQKSIISMLVIIICVVVFYNILIQMFPEFSTLFSQLKDGGFTRLVDLQRHYSTDYDMGRAVIFKYSNQYLLPHKWNQLIGMGVGNVTSSRIVNNDFWIKNQMTHYDQFYTSYLYNEQGIIGFLLYCLVYIELFIIGLKALFKSKTRKYGAMLIMLVCGCVMIFVYNMALYSQLCFIVFWALAVLTRKCIQLEERKYDS